MNIKDAKGYLRKKGEFRYNIIRGRIELKGKRESRYIAINDYEFNSIWVEMNERGIGISKEALISILISEFSQRFDPISEYLNALPIWNNSMPDYIHLLAETISVHDQSLWERMLRKWLVAV